MNRNIVVLSPESFERKHSSRQQLCKYFWEILKSVVLPSFGRGGIPGWSFDHQKVLYMPNITLFTLTKYNNPKWDRHHEIVQPHYKLFATKKQTRQKYTKIWKSYKKNCWCQPLLEDSGSGSVLTRVRGRGWLNTFIGSKSGLAKNFYRVRG